jgi:S-methylmethionine-dependent homocysteine/selenocysteine methylase
MPRSGGHLDRQNIGFTAQMLADSLATIDMIGSNCAQTRAILGGCCDTLIS